MISGKRNFGKSAHNFENDILVAARNICQTLFYWKDHIKVLPTLPGDLQRVKKKCEDRGQSVCFMPDRSATSMTVANISVWEMWQR